MSGKELESVDTAIVATPKEASGRKVVEFIVAQYNLMTQSCVLDWRRCICEMDPAMERLWPKFSRAVHRDFKRQWKTVRLILQEEFNVTAIAVSSAIFHIVKHGDPPLLDNETRTSSAYRMCLPQARAMARGMACFPSNVAQDHPLVIFALSGRGKSAASGLANALTSISDANSRGAISGDARQSILGRVVPGVADAISHSAIESEERIALPNQSSD